MRFLLPLLLLSCAPPIEVDDGSLTFGPVGPLTGEGGAGSFVFGAATAATQIEDENQNTDWYWWTLPTAQGGRGESVPIGEAVQGKTQAIEDIAIMDEMNLDAYRFSVSWSRIEPSRDEISPSGVAHYSDFLDGLSDAGIRPMITVHHFSNPLWTNDFLQGCPDSGPTDDNLCGWAHPEGSQELIEELREHGKFLAETYGDRVDDWCTINEPVNYLLASYGFGVFPPGESLLLSDFDGLVGTMRNMLAAHAALYDAIKTYDTIDADGDGLAANVGMSLSVAKWAPARDGEPSELEEDIAAAERVGYVYHHLFTRALTEGGFDADLDQELEEPHEDWAGTLDWLGLQYYFRTGVTGEVALLPGVDATICLNGFEDLAAGSCLEPEDETKWVPSMGYEYYEPGLGELLKEFGGLYPELPLVVTESGIATEVGLRRAENIVRSLEQIHGAIESGVDVRGYYHWSLIDNFEWAEGYEPKFGLYTVDRSTFERFPTEGANVLRRIAGTHKVSDSDLIAHGGLGPMTPEEEED